MESSRHWDICLRFGRAGIKNGGDWMPFKIVRNDITKMNTEAIVNTANDHATVGTGCDYAVYMAKRAIVDKKIFSKIKNNIDYHPQKLTALCLCVGAKLNLDEAKDLLARAGYALSPCDKTDIIFSYFIENEIYDMIELDIQLEEHGLPCIIS